MTAGGYDILRKDLFGKIDDKQFKGIEFIVEQCSAYGMNYPQCAYSLATVYHECGYVTNGAMYRSMQPVKERGSDLYLRGKKYFPYIGYGYVQLTWKENYQRVGKLIGVDLISNPELALEPKIAAEIMCQGMLHGWFTGVGFWRKCEVNKYDRSSYIRARKIINGTDKAGDIADYAMIFERALRSW